MFSRGLVFGTQPETGAQPDTTTLYDQSRYKNNGEMTAVTWTRLPSGLWAMNFDGASSRVKVNANINIVPKDGLSILWWGKSITFTNYDCWFGRSLDSNNYLYGAQRTGAPNNTSCLLYNGGAAQVSSIIGTFNSFAWNQYAVTFSSAGNDYKSYMNTILGGVDVSYTFPDLSTTNLYIGCLHSTYGFINAYISLFRIYNYALSAGQINKIFESERRWFGV